MKEENTTKEQTEKFTKENVLKLEAVLDLDFRERGESVMALILRDPGLRTYFTIIACHPNHLEGIKKAFDRIACIMPSEDLLNQENLLTQEKVEGLDEGEKESDLAAPPSDLRT